MLPLAGAVADSEPVASTVNARGMRSWVVLKECVTAPTRTSATLEMATASGEEIVKDVPYATEAGAEERGDRSHGTVVA